MFSFYISSGFLIHYPLLVLIIKILLAGPLLQYLGFGSHNKTISANKNERENKQNCALIRLVCGKTSTHNVSLFFHVGQLGSYLRGCLDPTTKLYVAIFPGDGSTSVKLII